MGMGFGIYKSSRRTFPSLTSNLPFKLRGGVIKREIVSRGTHFPVVKSFINET